MADDLTLGTAQVTAARDATDVRVVTVPVTNGGDRRVFVWATPRALTYDAAARTLSVRFAENPAELGPDVTVISTHPRLPAELSLDPGEQGRLEVRVPPVLQVIDLAAGGPGLGLQATEVPVGEIDRLHLEVATAGASFSEVARLDVGEMVPGLRDLAHLTAATVDVTPLQPPTGESTH